MDKKNQRRTFLTLVSFTLLSFWGSKKLNVLVNPIFKNPQQKITIHIHPNSIARKIKG